MCQHDKPSKPLRSFMLAFSTVLRYCSNHNDHEIPTLLTDIDVIEQRMRKHIN